MITLTPAALAADRAGLSLSALLTLAETRHAEYLADLADFAAAREADPIARSALLPQAATRWTWVEDEDTPNSYSFAVDQPLFNLPDWLSWRAAKKEVALATNTVQAARQTLRRDLINVWLDAQLAADVLNLIQARLKTLREQLSRAEALAAAGRATKNDVLSASAQLASARAQLEEAKYDLASAQDALLRYTDETAVVLRLAVVGERLPSLPPLPEWQRRVVTDGLTAAAARLQLEWIQAERRALDASVYPRVSLNGGWRRQAGGNNNNANGDSAGGWERYLELSIDQALFTGGRLTAEERRAQAQVTASEKRLHAVLRALRQETARLHGRMRSERARMEALAEAATAAEALLATEIVGYNSGVRIVGDVLRAEEDAFEARLDLRRSVYIYLENMVELHTMANLQEDDFILQLETLFERSAVPAAIHNVDNPNDKKETK